MTAFVRFALLMGAINIVMATVMSYFANQSPSFDARRIVVWVCAIILFTLNQVVGQKQPAFRKWVWSIQAANLISTLLFGAVGAFVFVVSAIWLLLTQLS